MGLGSTSFPSEKFSELTDGNVQKDTLLRTPASNVFIEIVTAMGYRTTTIPYAELYSALQAGVADGWIGGSPLVNWEGFRDVIKYFLDVNAVNECIPIAINTKLLKSMPEDYQKAITETFLEMANRVADERKGQEEQAVADMKKFNIKVIEPTAEELSALTDRIRAAVWNKMRNALGDDMINNLCDAYGVPKS
jgi:TRAP-type C4-dicarboxylate transport system substrate-binding protein